MFGLFLIRTSSAIYCCWATFIKNWDLYTKLFSNFLVVIFISLGEVVFDLLKMCHKKVYVSWIPFLDGLISWCCFKKEKLMCWKTVKDTKGAPTCSPL